MTDRLTFRAAVYLVLERPDSSFLLLKRAGTEYKSGYWGFPSGHVEEGETLDRAIKREVKEEIGLDLPLGLEPKYCQHRRLSNGLSYFDFFFVFEIRPTDVVINCEPSKCAQIKWFHDFPTSTTVEYLPFVVSAIDIGKSFGDYFEVV